MTALRIAWCAFVLGWAALPAAGAWFGRRAPRSGERPAAIALRKRVHVNTLIAQPDTMEFEWGGAVSTTGDFTLPTAVRFTPEGSHIWWGRTEFSAAFDSLSSQSDGGHRVTTLGDRATLAATCVLHDGDRLDVAFAPQASLPLHGASGVRAGATGIVRYDVGRSSAGVTLTWTGASEPSDSNPAGTLDVGAGYGWRLAPAGPLGHLTAHTNWLWERSSGVARQISAFEGVEYQVTERFAIDFSLAHLTVWGGETDHQAVVGLTLNTGRLHGERR